MAVIALQNAFCYIGSQDLTAHSNQIGVTVDVDDLDCTNFRSGGWRESIGGLRRSRFNMAGYWSSGGTNPDLRLWNSVGSTTIATFGNVETETEPCYISQFDTATYRLFGEVGQVAPFTIDARGTNVAGVVRGQLALKDTSSITATGAVGSGVQVGAVAADEYLYATWHTLGAAGTTITIDVESDDNSGFTTATSRGTIGPITGATGRWMTRVAGPITDDWYRFNITAITGTWQAAGAIAIG